MLKVAFSLAFSLASLIQIIYSQDGFATLGEGTTGGNGGSTVKVCSEDELRSAVRDDHPRIVILLCSIQLQRRIDIGSSKSILGGSADAGISGYGFNIEHTKNVIIRGLHICCAIAPTDGVAINDATNVWIDHNEFYSNLQFGEDYYDGLVDASNGADFITISWNIFHDHWKTSLIGNSDDKGEVDSGKLHVTYHHNYFYNCNSRIPSLRFGTAHIYNNFYENVIGSAINSRMGAQVLVEGNVFRNTSLALTTSMYSREDGYAVERNNDFGGSITNITQFGTFTSPPYSYRIDRLSKIPYLIMQNAGPTIIFKNF